MSLILLTDAFASDKLLEIPSNPEDFPSFPPVSPSKLPSGSFLLMKNGTELEIRPSSPHRYSTTSGSPVINPPSIGKHVRSSTISPRISKFIPATELISFEKIQTPDEERSNLEILEDFISNTSVEEEPKHFAIYNSAYNNRNSILGSTLDILTPKTNYSPQDQRMSTIYTVSSVTSKGFNLSSKMNSDDFKENFAFGREKLQGQSRKIYCERCEKNVKTCLRVKKASENL